jgi:hypothetical protein
MNNFRIRKTSRALLLLFLAGLIPGGAFAQKNPDIPGSSTCQVKQVNYLGWQAQQVANPWVRLIFVPQNGGRLMQVLFDGHPFLFVNPEYAGKHLPPSNSEWFNYGGDKLWVLPEGNEDEHHWAGNSDILDDGPFAFEIISQGQRCEVKLTGPADIQTGLQFTRTVSVDGDSPRIKFHAVFTNATGHPIEWSIQSVSQYNTADASDPARHNQKIWGFSPANPTSSYLNRYHVKFGPAENLAAHVREDGLFAVHYVPLAAELWLDSKDGWLAVVDGASQYAMVERFRYDETKPYPGKASVIFWTNGQELHQAPDGTVTFGRAEKAASPFYMEAELNSPLVRLFPGESHSFDTEWFPTRGDSGFRGVADAGVVLKPLKAVEVDESGKIRLTGTFGVFYSGKVEAHFYGPRGAFVGARPLVDVDPRKISLLEISIDPPSRLGRVSLHLVDSNGIDRGVLGEVAVEGAPRNP